MLRITTPMRRSIIPLFICLALVPAAHSADFPEQVQDLEKKLPEITIKEAVINVSPKMQFYLPSGSMDLALKQEYRRAGVEFLSRYDFVDNFMGFNIDFLYKLSPLSLGVNLNDTVDFSEVISNTEYLQRSQFIAPYAQYDLGYHTNLRAGIRFENTFTSFVDSQTFKDRGRNILGEVVLWRDTLSEARAYPEGGRSRLSLFHSFKNLGSDYDYTLAELDLHLYLYPFDRHVVEYYVQAGYPVRQESRPLTSLYTAGGYRILRGYRFKEFRGSGILYNMLVYKVPLVKLDGKGREPNLAVVSWDFFAEAAKIGEREIFTAPGGGFKSSAGMGIGYRIVLFNLFPVQVELSGAKAFEARGPQIYFSVSTIYYTWKPQ